jgi:pimeloyl-ACP methyl ester carboxylesterase
MLELLAKKCMVIVMDNRGTGRSSKPTNSYTLEMMANDSVAVLDSLGIEKAHIMGFSMGGMITQVIGLDHPEKVISLVLCGTTVGKTNSIQFDLHTLKELALIRSPLPEMTDRDRVIKLLYMLYARDYVEENLEELVIDETYNDYPTPDHTLIRQSQAIAAFESYHRLPLIKVPVLVMTGEDDILVPPENSKVIAERIYNSELVIIPGCGHGFLKQKTNESVSIILRFLERFGK